MTIPATLMDAGDVRVRALVVDDSAVAREVISAALSMSEAGTVMRRAGRRSE